VLAVVSRVTFFAGEQTFLEHCVSNATAPPQLARSASKKGGGWASLWSACAA